MNDLDPLKRRAAEHAVHYVTSNSVLGLGSGSTMRYALEEISRRLTDGRLHNIVGVPTSERTAAIAHYLGIPLTSLDQHPEMDLTIDGADEIDPNLDLIKGRGGALLREKIVASVSRELLIIADSSKLVPQLGSHCLLPIEVVPFAVPLLLHRLAALGGSATVRHTTDGQPFLTDNQTYILDYNCGPIADPAALDITLLRMPGVVDHGLFLGMARRAIIAGQNGIRMLERGTA